MRRRPLGPARNDHPNVVPLIDVIMCLIVFFMLIARFGVDSGEDESIAIPPSVLGSDIQDMGNTLVLNVAPPTPGTDQPAVSALINDQIETLRVVDTVTGRSPLVESLRFFRYGADGKVGGEGTNRDNDEFKVILRGEADIDYRYLEPVLGAIANAGVANVAYQTAVVRQ